VFAEAPTVLVETPPVAFPPPAKKPAQSPVPVEAKAAPIVARPSAFESARPAPSTIAPRRAGRVRPIWQSPRYLVPSVAVLLVAGFGTYYVASTVTSSRREAQDRSAREAAEQQRATAQQQRGAVDQLRATMVAAKQRASTSAPEFARALETERQGVAIYAQASFTEAAASFRAATELFAKALPPPEPPKAPAVAATPSVPVAPSAPAAPGA